MQQSASGCDYLDGDDHGPWSWGCWVVATFGDDDEMELCSEDAKLLPSSSKKAISCKYCWNFVVRYVSDLS